MLSAQAEEFMQLTWTVILMVPAIMALLHVPLACQWVWRKTLGGGLCAA
jgi:hypothetical protein